MDRGKQVAGLVDGIHRLVWSRETEEDRRVGLEKSAGSPVPSGDAIWRLLLIGGKGEVNTLSSLDSGEETLEDILNGGRDDTETWKVPSLFFVHHEAFRHS